ncbi:Cof-type HAD-IIB family hydrolase [Ornithinibacillus contaminans]|uniref:Cof-type HAD-IIB family hydrolase n=1 Tax=Ornithinibacillus contaminans TaxID=694055 RepID=UPI00064E13D1|nr:Cof-type HAD-IIB family hydrolase [Ornithinibacillus contaminans]
MTYKILFLDIDGTILKPDHTYHPKTKEAIKQIQSQGMEVFLATGRPAHELSELAEELQVESYIGYNGAYAVYQDETILDEPMKKETLIKYLEIAKESGHEIILYTSERNYVTSTDSPYMIRFMELFQLTEKNLITEDILDDVLGATLLNVPPEETSRYEIDDIRLAQVNVNGAENCYDVIRKAVNKGEAVRTVLNRLNIPKEQAIAFGDGMNDKEMLELVGEGFAMGNAHPDLFQYANHKTTTVSEAGVFSGLEKLGLVK